MDQSLKAVLRLRQMILDGELPPGERLSEPVLAERIEVSRTPIRAALIKLEHEGLVELLPSGGYRIRVFQEKEIFEAIELRGTLEGLAARLAAERRPNRSETAGLQECLRAIDAVIGHRAPTEDDFLRYMEANARFHQAIISLAHSEVLGRALERSATLPFASPNAFVMAQAILPESHEILFLAQYQHRCLADAIAAGESARAESLAREHARIAQHNLQIVLNSQHASERVPGLRLVRRAVE